MLGNGGCHGGLVQFKILGQRHADVTQALQSCTHGIHDEARLGGQDFGARNVTGHGQQGNQFIRTVAQHQVVTRRQIDIGFQSIAQGINACARIAVDGHRPQALAQLGLQGRGQAKGVFHRIQLDHADRMLDGIGMHGLDVLANEAKWRRRHEVRILFRQAHLGRPCMGLQALAMCQHRSNLPQCLGTGLADLDEAAAFLKIVHPQR